MLLPDGCNVESVGAIISISLGPDGVADCLEDVEGVVTRNDVIEQKSHLFLLRELVQSSGLEVVEGVIRGSK